ncbi:TPR repeat containing exported protein; Putative periplasmic protein contains a protein prenylyltransferase domain [hydrothermal vent metagenome]|uniref:TPR repeat containing exported protein Putative periplasmic protein contains a protein prenylyltransferase domain n=1 Tax=hydrothermal vent metagenome TaxID=652676 RepID=A0A3B1BK81_9ZZZZ
MKYTGVVFTERTRRLCFYVIILILTAGAGCASVESPKKSADDLSALKENVWALQKQTAELGLKISDMSNDLSILKEHLKAVSDKSVKDNSVSDKSEPVGKALKSEAPPEKTVSEPEKKNIQVKDERPQKTVESKAPPQTGAGINNAPPSPPSNIVLASSGAQAPIGQKFKNLDDNKMYKQAMDMFNSGEYSGAAARFSYFVRRYRTSHLTPNAQYWLGEAFYSQKNYDRAAIEFKKTLMRYPASLKTPDAMLKLAFCKIKLNLFPEGKKVLREVIDKYPSSVAASTARRELEKVDKNDKEMSEDS